MIENSFLVCGIHDTKKVRNNEFLKKIMNNVNEKIAVGEEALLRGNEENPFSDILGDLYTFI